MAVFGRDTLITCLQTLIFGPELAQNALTALADAPGDARTIRSSTPSRARSSTRSAPARPRPTWFPRYYGTVDATPLFLVLLSELWRWTDDAAFVRTLREPALRALNWIDEYGDLDGDGFVEYHRRSERGLENQSWKDSAQLAALPGRTPGDRADRRRARCRATCTTRRCGWPSWRARSGATATSPTGSSARRPSCASASTRRSGARSAAASTRSRSTATRTGSTRSRRTSAISSGAGSSRSNRVDAVVDRLMGEELWSGWGVRTMSAGDAGYSPLTYHNGTVWPHDNSLIAWGLARAGPLGGGAQDRAPLDRGGHVLRPPAARGLRGLPAHRDAVPDRLPDGGPPAGLGRRRRRCCSSRCCSACGPTTTARRSRRSRRRSCLPGWARSDSPGVRAFDKVWNVIVSEGHVRVEETEAPELE